MMFVFRIFLLCFMCGLSLPQAQAQERARFFSAMQDVPILAGMRELPEQALSYDSAGGRIVESVAVIDGRSQEDLLALYMQTLPQLGWNKIDAALYERNKEYLAFDFSVQNEGGLTTRFLKVTVKPFSGDAP